MKTEHAIIAAVVIIGVLFAANSLLGLTKNEATTTTSRTTLMPAASTSSVTSTTTTTSRTTTSSSTTTTTTSSTTTTTLHVVADPKATVEITADKSLYYSNQLMTFTVLVNSSDNLSYSKMSLRGIMAGYYRIDEDNTVNLSKGVNTLSFQYRAPKCYGCSGILPGKYNVSVELAYYGRTIGADTIRIEMKQ
jgi:hypothetical protein